MFIVTTSSEEYGNDEFRYDDFDEALAGLCRLARAGFALKDGVERSYLVREENDSDDDS